MGFPETIQHLDHLIGSAKTQFESENLVVRNWSYGPPREPWNYWAHSISDQWQVGSFQIRIGINLSCIEPPTENEQVKIHVVELAEVFQIGSLPIVEERRSQSTPVASFLETDFVQLVRDRLKNLQSTLPVRYRR